MTNVARQVEPQDEPNFEKDIDGFWGEQWRQNPVGFDFSDHILRHKFEIFLKPVLDCLPYQARVCELGVGAGQWLLACKAYRPDLSLYGVDLSPKALEVASSRGITCTRADIRQLPFSDGYFDLCFSWGVIEHLEDSEEGAREQIRVSSKACIIDVPLQNSIPDIVSRKREIRKRNLSDYEARIEFGKTFTFRAFRQMITKVKPQGWNSRFACNFQVLPPLPYVGYVLDRLIPNWVRSRYAHNIGVILWK